MTEQTALQQAVSTLDQIRKNIEDAINAIIDSTESITNCRVVIYQHMPTTYDDGTERSGRVSVEVKL